MRISDWSSDVCSSDLRSGSDFRIRSDLSATLFLEEPETYEGGELTIEDHFGVQQVKLAAGHMVLYPASSLHRVEQIGGEHVLTPVTNAHLVCRLLIEKKKTF